MTEDLRAQALTAAEHSRAGADPDYPVVHVVPPVGRLNDPNGLLVDDGTYHAFYQYTPMHGQRRLVYWGHSSSTDLFHWDHHEPAIVPDSSYDASGAYSGNALVLEGQELAAAPAQAPYQLFYTGNLKDPVTDHRTPSQCLVTSGDLETFTKWPSNPLIADHAPGYTPHFRDPQVSRDPEHPGAYRMLIGAQRADSTGAAVLYRSTDLLAWQEVGEITFPDAAGAFDSYGYMWECPGIVELTDEATGQRWDVLIWCPQGVEPERADGYSTIFPCVYTVGHLVGTELRDCDGTVRQVDHGTEFYAPQVFARRPSEPGPVLMCGWAGNASQDDQPSIGTGGWVHTLTAPRALSLRNGRLIQRLPALPGRRTELAVSGTTVTAQDTPLAELDGHRAWHLVLELGEMTGAFGPHAHDQPPLAGVSIGSRDCRVDIALSAVDQGLRVNLDRSRSRYAAPEGHRTLLVPPGTARRLEILHDRSITEVIVGQGDAVLTTRSFVDPASSGARLTCSGSVEVLRAEAVVLD